MAGRAKENLPGGSLKYLLVYFKVRIFKCSYRILHYPCTPPTLFGSLAGIFYPHPFPSPWMILMVHISKKPLFPRRFRLLGSLRTLFMAITGGMDWQDSMRPLQLVPDRDGEAGHAGDDVSSCFINWSIGDENQEKNRSYSL